MSYHAQNPYELPDDYDPEIFDDEDLYGDDVFDFEVEGAELEYRRAESEINDFYLMERNG